MKQSTNSTFNDGLIMDLNPLLTPQTCMTDCLNGTLITYNGNEFTLQTDSGNIKITDSEIPNGFIPLDMKEYGGIIYLALYNPENNQCEIGSLPSPNYDITPNKNDTDVITINSSNSIDINQDGSYSFKQMFMKLFEFEQITLNPGDEYAIGYKIVSGTNVFNKSLYNVELYAIDKDSKQHKLENPNLVESPITQSEFKYFNQTLSSILALKIKINDIDWFETTAFETATGIKFAFYGKNKLNELNNASDDLYIKGCKIAYNNTVKYLTGGIAEDSFKFNYLLNDSSILEGSLVKFNIIPFDQYRYLTELSRNLSIKIGEKADPNRDINIFKYKYSAENKSFRLDFSMPTLSMKEPFLYLEFYDIWSDYSVVIPIEDINPIGVNTVFIDTVKEPVESYYYGTNCGGVNTNVLSDYVYADEIGDNRVYQPVLASKVRRSKLLRENNLYLVRIASIDKATIDSLDTPIPVAKYNYKHKLLAVNENFNSLYDDFSNSDTTADIDFNNYDLNKNIRCKLDLSLNKVSDEESPVVISDGLNYNTIINGEKFYYKLTEGNIQLGGDTDTYKESFKKTSMYNLDSYIKSIPNAYGKVTLDNVEMNGLSATYEITEEDQNVTSSFDYYIDDANKRSLKLFLKTSRSINAKCTKEAINGKVEKSSARLIDKFEIANDSANTAGMRLDGNANYNFPRKLIKKANNKEYLDNNGVGGDLLKIYYDDNNVSGGALEIDGSYDGNVFTLRLDESGKEFYNDRWFLTLRSADGPGIGVLFKNKDTVMKILRDLKAVVYKEQDSNMYYYTNIDYNAKSKSSLMIIPDCNIATYITIKQNIKEADTFVSCVTNNELITKLSKRLADKGITLGIANTQYINLGQSSYNEYQELNKLYVSLEKGSSEIIKNKVVESKNQLFANNPGLTKPIEAERMVFSQSGLYKNIANKFSVTYDANDQPLFYYKVQNPKYAHWIADHKNGVAFNVDVNEFDLY